jgi:RNA polymerase sigma-70 factor, ECF subfamily
MITRDEIVGLTTDVRGLLGDSAEAFGARIDPYRHELLVHCYRMLGSIEDAEDAVQDTLVRAWNGRATFRRAISFRAWLYRIATNACLDTIDRRKRGRGGEESLGVGPYPDDVLGPAVAGPEARFAARESISLAFLTVLQVLPPRQRAVLILRDVLSWRAAEVAALLELSVPAVNSALHRARVTVSREYSPRGGAADGDQVREPGHLRALLDRYIRAWETADVAGLVALLRDDAVVSMPPGLTILGRDEIGAFLRGSVFRSGTRIRLQPTRANGSPAFAVYSGDDGDAPLRGYAILVLEIDVDRIAAGAAVARMSVFADPGLIPRFGLAEELAG